MFLEPTRTPYSHVDGDTQILTCAASAIFLLCCIFSFVFLLFFRLLAALPSDRPSRGQVHVQLIKTTRGPVSSLSVTSLDNRLPGNVQPNTKDCFCVIQCKRPADFRRIEQCELSQWQFFGNLEQFEQSNHCSIVASLRICRVNCVADNREQISNS